MPINGGSESFHAIASLPRPIDSSNGRVLVSSVQAISGPKKRKRAEVALSVDGEGVQIYDVQTPRLVTSYAVPPQAYFTHPPCSLYRRHNKKGRSSRLTYTAIRNTLQNPSTQIKCFIEEYLPGSSAESKTLSYAPQSTEANIVAIEPVLDHTTIRESLGSPCVVAVLENGTLLGLNEDLSFSWENGLESLTKDNEAERLSDITVEYVSSTNASAVKKGLFLGREDIVASLQVSEEDSEVLDATPILCVISRARGSNEGRIARYMSILRIYPVSLSCLHAQRSPVQHLATWRVPTDGEDLANEDLPVGYHLQPSSGNLQQLRNGSIITHDFSGTVPKVHKRLQLPGDNFYSFIRVSPHRILACSSVSCGLYDTTYSSIQSSYDLSLARSTIFGKKKGKSDKEIKGLPLILSTYFSTLGLAVGIADGTLIGLQVEDDRKAKRRKPDGLLIHSIGRGIESGLGATVTTKISNGLLGDAYVHSNKEDDTVWSTRMKELNEYAAADDVHKFEETFADILKIERISNVQRARSAEDEILSGGKGTNAMTNGLDKGNVSASGNSPFSDFGIIPEDEGQLLEWKLPSTISDQDRAAHRLKALYALSKTFTWNDSNTRGRSKGAIKLVFLAPNVLQWVVLMGCFNKSDIERALRSNSSPADRLKSLEDGDIVSAIVSFNPDMILLDSILNQPCHLPAAELVQAIKLLIQSLDTKPAASSTRKFLTFGGAEDEGEDSDGNVTDLDVEEAAEDASEAIDLALSTLEYGLPIRSRTLHAALTKLHAFPAPTVVHALRAALTHHELVFLIHLLRIELRDGGWLSRYTAQDPTSSSSSPDGPRVATTADNFAQPADHAIVTIASLLNSALDAVGAAGWLSSPSLLSSSSTSTSAQRLASSGSDGGDPLLRALHQEVTAALEGVHELTYLRSIIGEFLRYAGRVDDAVTATSGSKSKSHNHHHHHPTPHQQHQRDSKKRKKDKSAAGVDAAAADGDVQMDIDFDLSATAAAAAVDIQEEDDRARRARTLPLGLRPPDPLLAAATETEAAGAAGVVPLTKADVGGRAKPLTSRERGREISRRVPRYCVERIRI